MAASSGRLPSIAVLNTVTSATENSDDATNGRSLTYSASANAERPRRTSPTGSTSISSAAVQRSSPASG